MKVSKTAKIGILSIACLGILIWGLNFLKGRDLFRSEKIYLARYSNVGGLESSSDITLNGLKVGYVRSIQFTEDRSGDLLVKLAIHRDFQLPVGTTAEIISSDLLGSRAVRINLGKGDNYYEPGDTIPSAVEADLRQQVSEQIAPLKAKAESLLSSLDSAITVVTYIFNEDARKNLTESFEHINNTILHLESTSRNMDQLIASEKENLAGIIQNLRNVTNRLSDNSENINNILGNFSTFSDTLAAIELQHSVNKLNNTLDALESVMTKIDHSEGTLGQLVNNEGLYQNLSLVSENLNRLIMDVRQNPKRYIHFSAFDTGKEIYLTTSPEKQTDGSVTFRVLVVSTTTAIPLNSPVFQEIENVTEYKIGSTYNYFTGEETEFDKIRIILNNAQKLFPDASIVAFKNGKKIRLEKALKMISQ